MMKQRQLTNGQLTALCMELAVMLHAGLGTGDGLYLLRQDAEAALQPVLEALQREVEAGRPLSDAMGESGAFPDYVRGLTACGERTGRLEEALRALSSYYDSRERLERRMRGALLYPAVLAVVMLVVITVLLARVLPVFDQVFASLGGSMTGLAGGLLALGRGLDAAMPALLVLLAAAVGFLAAFAGSDRFRSRLLSRWQRRDRGVSRQVDTARFAQSVAMGLASGLPVEEAVKLASRLLEGSPRAAARCRDCLKRLTDGADLAEALWESGVLPAASCRMLALGMRSGSGDTVMSEIARRLAEESEDAIEAAVSRVEPALVIVTSLLVGAILLSVMLPLMNIMAAIG